MGCNKMSGKLSNKEMVGRVDTFQIDKCIIIAKLKCFMPLLYIKYSPVTNKHNSDFGWVGVYIYKKSDDFVVCKYVILLVHPSKQIVKYDNINYGGVSLNDLAVKIYSDLGMTMEALLWSITK